MFSLYKRRRRPDAAPAVPHDGARVTLDELIALRLNARRLPLGSRRPALAIVAGGHRSPFRGRGMDYQESRNYQPGDDIRHMDWRVTARTDRPHIKVYQEERERPVVVLVDLSPTMFFGTQGAFKSVTAARAAALIGWAAIHNGDRIGALLFNGGHQELRPASGRRGAMHLVRSLVEATDPRHALDRIQTEADADTSSAAAAGSGNGLGTALGRLRRVARPGSLVVMISDFYGLDAEAERHLGRLRLHNDLVALQILDPLETSPPPPGRYGVTDGQRTAVLDSNSAAVRDGYSAWFRQRHQALEALLRSHTVPLLRLTTTDDVADTLRHALVTATSAHFTTPLKPAFTTATEVAA